MNDGPPAPAHRAVTAALMLRQAKEHLDVMTAELTWLEAHTGPTTDEGPAVSVAWGNVNAMLRSVKRRLAMLTSAADEASDGEAGGDVR